MLGCVGRGTGLLPAAPEGGTNIFMAGIAIKKPQFKGPQVGSLSLFVDLTLLEKKWVNFGVNMVDENTNTNQRSQ